MIKLFNHRWLMISLKSQVEHSYIISPVAIITNFSYPLQFWRRQLIPLLACTFPCTPHCLQVYSRVLRSVTYICPQDSHFTISLFLRCSWVARCRVSLGYRMIRVSVGCCIIIYVIFAINQTKQNTAVGSLQINLPRRSTSTQTYHIYLWPKMPNFQRTRPAKLLKNLLQQLLMETGPSALEWFLMMLTY